MIKTLTADSTTRQADAELPASNDLVHVGAKRLVLRPDPLKVVNATPPRTKATRGGGP